MTQRIQQVKPKQLIKALQTLGFEVRRQTGIPIHSKDIKRGLLFGILKQAGISQQQLRDTF